MKTLLLVAMLALVGCATAKPLGLVSVAAYMCDTGPESMPGALVCGQVLDVKPGCTVLMAMPVQKGENTNQYFLGMVCEQLPQK
jgi:hypothetical protein